MGRLQWQRLQAQESRGPARDASGAAAGEAHTTPQGPFTREGLRMGGVPGQQRGTLEGTELSTLLFPQGISYLCRWPGGS